MDGKIGKPLNSTLTSRCKILGSLWILFKDTDHETWAEFFTWADIGLPLAYSAWEGLAEVTPDGAGIINETWKVFCEMSRIDPDGHYVDLEAAFAAVPDD
jgi:hypothetical protein